MVKINTYFVIRDPFGSLQHWVRPHTWSIDPAQARCFRTYRDAMLVATIEMPGLDRARWRWIEKVQRPRPTRVRLTARQRQHLSLRIGPDGAFHATNELAALYGVTSRYVRFVIGGQYARRRDAAKESR